MDDTKRVSVALPAFGQWDSEHRDQDILLHFANIGVALDFHARLTAAIEEWSAAETSPDPPAKALLGPNWECESATADQLARDLFEMAAAMKEVANPPAETWHDRPPLL